MSNSFPLYSMGRREGFHSAFHAKDGAPAHDWFLLDEAHVRCSTFLRLQREQGTSSKGTESHSQKGVAFLSRAPLRTFQSRFVPSPLLLSFFGNRHAISMSLVPDSDFVPRSRVIRCVDGMQ